MLYFNLCPMVKTVYASLTWITLAAVIMNAKQVPLTEDVLLSNFIQKYVQPYVESETKLTKLIVLSDRNRKSAKHRSSNHTDYREIINYIAIKVNELRPFLQDDTVGGYNRTLFQDDNQNIEGDNNLALEGKDETTIIEFIPKIRANTRTDENAKLIETKAKDFQENLLKYKELRSKIRKALKRENISKNTKNLITNTLDKMIAQMIAHKCTWKDSIGMRSLKENDNKQSADIAKSWNEMWQNLKHQYASTNVNKDIDADLQKDIFLTKFQDLVSVMTSDLNTMVSKYKVVCHLKSLDGNSNVDNSKEENQYLRVDSSNKTVPGNTILNKEVDKSTCVNFKICTEELMDFLLDFYISLNETTTSTINNYAAMFLRDVSDDGYHEKERVVGLIQAISKAVQKKIEIVFKKQLNKLKLDDQNNQNANVKSLTTLVLNTTRRVKKSTHKQIELGLQSVRGKLMLTVQKDIDVNLEYDLEKLEKDINDKTCQVFETCNGNVFSRKTNYVGNNKNNVYVKVQLNLRDEESSKTDTTTVESATRYKHFRVIITESPLHYNVTRTRRREMNTEKNNQDNLDYLIIEPTTITKMNILRPKSKHQKRVLDFIQGPDVVIVNVTMIEDNNTDKQKKIFKKLKLKRSNLRRLPNRLLSLDADETLSRKELYNKIMYK